MVEFDRLEVPEEGERIEMVDDQLEIPDKPIIPFIVGDGIGPDIRKASKIVFEAAIEEAYDGEKEIVWMELPAGEEAEEVHGTT